MIGLLDLRTLRFITTLFSDELITVQEVIGELEMLKLSVNLDQKISTQEHKQQTYSRRVRKKDSKEGKEGKESSCRIRTKEDSTDSVLENLEESKMVKEQSILKEEEIKFSS
ncbi:MAG: hypothetical protein EZS28_053530 [Streblomastix strix]|uniref:Uncharacterized protein n=1 Tax=Streblomastix strix TaxID=222440 RepID=A0A5J4RB06_9EUKA|nr:MAG: hypothetical protein EZS28_053530 [Streblomastix strix]